MKINSINNISFGRVVKIASVPDSRGNKRTNPQELLRVLKNQSTRLYSREEISKIKGFFAEKLGDYDGRNEIIMRRTSDWRNVLISGRDAQDILKLELRKSKEVKKISQKCALSNKQEKALSDMVNQDVNKEIMKRLEDGSGNKQETAFYIKNDSSISPKGKITSVTYEQIKPYYSAQKDGHMLTDAELKHYPHIKTSVAGVRYESETINLT